MKRLYKQEAVHVHTSRTTCRVPTETDAEDVGSKTWSRGEKQSATKKIKSEKAKWEMSCKMGNAKKNFGVKKERKKEGVNARKATTPVRHAGKKREDAFPEHDFRKVLGIQKMFG